MSSRFVPQILQYFWDSSKSVITSSTGRFRTSFAWVLFFFWNRPPAKLSRHIKITNTCRQRKTFHKLYGMFCTDSFSGNDSVISFFFLSKRSILSAFFQKNQIGMYCCNFCIPCTCLKFCSAPCMNP